MTGGSAAMARLILSVTLLFVICWTTPCDSSNILFVQVYGSMSHTHSFIPAMEGLAIRGGHNVTLLAMFTPKSEIKGGVNILPLKTSLDWLEAENPTMLNMRDLNLTFWRYFLKDIPDGVCRSAFRDPNFQRVVADRSTKYDVVIVDPLMSECAMALVWLLDSPPLIFYCTTALYTLQALSLNIPVPLAYVPVSLSPLKNRMTFWERFNNLLTFVVMLSYRKYYLLPAMEDIVRQFHPNVPSLLAIEQNASFVFTNSHSPSLDFPRPLAPFLVEVGGIHCRPAKPLSKDLEDFIQGAGENGFVYFSLGTNVKGVDLPPAKIDVFLKAFGRLKQRVIWKFEDKLKDLPANVRVLTWLSQQDILGHPKVKAFITQGGQLSIQEAVYHAAPILGLPVLGDQTCNVRNLVDNGMGEELDYDFLTEDLLYDKLTLMASNNSYKENCRKHSREMRDRPMDPIDTIVYWVEYVIRHNGAHHLKLNPSNLNFFQYFLLDIIAVICASLAITMFIIIGAIRLLLRMTFGKSRATSTTVLKGVGKKLQ